MSYLNPVNSKTVDYYTYLWNFFRNMLTGVHVSQNKSNLVVSVVTLFTTSKLICCSWIFRYLCLHKVS